MLPQNDYVILLYKSAQKLNLQKSKMFKPVKGRFKEQSSNMILIHYCIY